MRGSLDARITQVLRQGAVDLHGLTVALWPCLECGPRETALTAINYLRTRVAAMEAGGTITSAGGLLTLNLDRSVGRDDALR